ncbi:MAG: hypothetical protein Q9222_006498 [Ikaeria aurantiellina]
MDSRFSSQPPLPDYTHAYPSTTRPSNAASQRLRPTPNPPLHTLPPISSQDYSYTFPTENSTQRAQSSALQNQSTSFPVYAPTANTQYHTQTYPPASRSIPSPNNYSPQSWLPQTSAPQAYQPYHPSASQQAPASLLPIPNGNTNQQTTYFPQSSTPSGNPHYETQRQHQPSSQNHSPQPGTHQDQQQQQPTHVVGSQGRRGILPSASGRPTAVVSGTASSQKASSTPVKDAEGKFPCEHCNKNYLHAKHLKRHLLRHTGVRPYSCGLCEDTFSRSDILKRHFQKCSVRRGNPTGASHLTHSRASKKGKPNAVEQLSIPLANSSNPTNSAPSSQTSQHSGQNATLTPTIQSPFELQAIDSLRLGGTAAYQEELHNFSSRASRANSMKRSSNGITINSRTASGPSSVGGPDSAFPYSTGQVTPDSLTTSGAATPYSLQHDGRMTFSPDGNFHVSNGSGLDLHNIARPQSGPAYATSSHPHIMGSANGSRNDLDLAHIFSSTGQDDFNHHYSTHHEEANHSLKQENDFSNMHYPVGNSYSNYLQK